jgi:hypothetical protein
MHILNAWSHTRGIANHYGNGEKNADAENKQHFVRILCGDNFVVRRINTTLDAQIAEKAKYVFIQ